MAEALCAAQSFRGLGQRRPSRSTRVFPCRSVLGILAKLTLRGKDFIGLRRNRRKRVEEARPEPHTRLGRVPLGDARSGPSWGCWAACPTQNSVYRAEGLAAWWMWTWSHRGDRVACSLVRNVAQITKTVHCVK